MKKIFTLILVFVCCSLLAHAQKFPVDTILYNGASDKHINFVFLSDGYQAHELEKYIKDVENTVDGIFGKPPFTENKNFFNVFAIKVPSKESGASHPGTANDESGAGQPVASVDNYFGSTFDYGGIHRLLVPTKNQAISAVMAHNFPEYDQIFVLVNSPYYGGSGGTYATSSTHHLSKEVAIHEIGHSFANLADEYWAGPQYARERHNLTQVSSPDNVKWKKWLNDTGVGVYPHEEANTWFRPHQRCNMRYLSTATEVIHFCKVCNEAFTNRMKALVNQYAVPATPGPISGLASLCKQQKELVYTIEKVSGAGSYTWTVPSGYSILSGQGTHSITVNAGSASGNISVVAQNFNGVSSASSLQVTINTLPVIVAGANETVCTDKGSFVVSGFSPAGGTWSGKGVAADGTFDPETAGHGSHTLTYTFKQGDCSASASKTITVSPKPVVSLAAFEEVCSSSTEYLLTGGTPAGGSYSGPHVSNGTFNAAAAGNGTHRIAYTYTAAGCTVEVTQDITVNTCTSVNEEEIATGILLFPNPTSATVLLEAKLTGSSEATIQVFDMAGKLVFTEKIMAVSGNLKKQIDLSAHRSGLYLVSITTDKGVVNRRIMLQ